MRKVFFSILPLLILVLFISYTDVFAKGRKAPKLKLKSLDGEVVSYKDLMGKPTVLVFWAVNCHSCKDELPKLNKLYEEYKDEVNFYAVVVNVNDLDEVRKTKEQWGFKMPVLIGTPETIYRFRIIGTPITYVITPEWRIYKQYIGKTDLKKLEKVLEDLDP